MVVVVGALLATTVACSSRDDASEGSDSGSTRSTLATIVAVTTTTELAGDPVSDAEAYAAAGLDVAEGECVSAAGVDGEFEVSYGVELGDATVLTAEDGTMIAVPASLRTGAELEALLLDALAADCADATALDALAESEGAAGDAAAISEDLPAYLLHRRADGATAREQTCLEEGFRAAPVQLSSLVARPAVVESVCATADRRASWRRTALDRGLAAAGVPEGERECISGDATAQLALASAVEAFGSGDPASDPMRDATNDCVTPERLGQLALDLVAADASFGVEELAPTAAG